MKIHDFMALFPITVEITEQMIKEGRNHLFQEKHCVGAQALMAAVPNIAEITCAWGWGVKKGELRLEGGSVLLGTQQDVDMMDIKQPTVVTLQVEAFLLDKSSPDSYMV